MGKLLEIGSKIGKQDCKGREICVGDIYKDEENFEWEVIYYEEGDTFLLENVDIPGKICLPISVMNPNGSFEFIGTVKNE